MPKPEPLALEAAIPDKDAAIKFGGGAGDHAVLTLQVYASVAEYARLLELRGERLIVTFIKEDDLPRRNQ